MEKYVDLHIHTCCSDGSDTAEEVLKLAVTNSVSILSITDHNTLEAYSERLFCLSEQMGIVLVPGVELDVQFKDHQYHLLGYGIDVNNNRLREVCMHNSAVQEAYNVEVLRCMEKDHVGVSEEEYNQYVIPNGRGGWKLLNYLLDIGITTYLLEGIKYYKQYGFDPSRINFVSFEEAVEVIKDAGGVSVLAHPAEQIPYNQYDDNHDIFMEKISDILLEKVEGIECIHPLHDFELQRKLVLLCNEKNLYVSGGTDYHGSFFNKQKQTIGGQFIKEDVVRKLIDKFC